MKIGYGAKQHDAYEVSPFYYGKYSLTTGTPRGVAGLGIQAGHRSVPITGPVGPNYWQSGQAPRAATVAMDGMGQYWDMDTGKRLDGMGDYWNKNLEGMGQFARAKKMAMQKMATRRVMTGFPGVDREGAEDIRAPEYQAALTRSKVAVDEAIERRVRKGQHIPRRLRNAAKPIRTMTPLAEAPVREVRERPHPVIRARGMAGFLQWLRAAHPFVFNRMEREHPEFLIRMAGVNKLSGLGQAEDPVASEAPPSQSWSTNIFQFLTSALDRQQEKDIMEMQLQAASRAEPPKVYTDAATGVPISGGGAGFDPRVLIWPVVIGGAALAVFAFMR
jgi:hypothetical protein